VGLLTVEGTYRDGKVLLDEKPSFARDDARVLVRSLRLRGERPDGRMQWSGLIARFRQGFH